MFELPEYLTLSRQINETLRGKTVRRGSLGNTPHKFVWYNRTHAEFEDMTRGRTFGESHARGRWLFIPVEPGYMLVFGECGGRVLYHPPETRLPQSYHLLITFEDGSSLSVTTQMWGAMELYETGAELERQYVKGMRTTPADPGFTWEYFDGLIAELVTQEKRSVKSLLTQEQLIPGLGNSSAQDILFHAGLHPKHPIQELNPSQRRLLYEAILRTVREISAKGGRYDEVDLFGRPGGYIRLMDKNALQRPCPVCGGEVQKISYLGGACYFCPHCQE
jgi:formamidopyrimidine-DNA glycosylase